MSVFALIFTLSVIGMAETIYLIRKRIVLEKSVCPIEGHCDLALTGKYNKFFGIIPNDVLGLLFYITVSLNAGLLAIGTGPFDLLNSTLKIFVAAGSVVSLYLAYLQWKVIKGWCFWCLMSAFIIWLMGVIILIIR